MECFEFLELMLLSYNKKTDEKLKIFMIKYVVKFVKIEISADNVHKNICGIRILFFYTFCKKMYMKSCIKFSRFFKTKKN